MRMIQHTRLVTRTRRMRPHREERIPHRGVPIPHLGLLIHPRRSTASSRSLPRRLKLLQMLETMWVSHQIPAVTQKQVDFLLPLDPSMIKLCDMLSSRSTPTREFVQTHSWLYWISYAIFLTTYITLVCCGNVRRNYPTNLIALTIFTLAMSYMVGMITSFYAEQANGLETVVISLAICVGVVLSVSIFACQTRWDFTGCGGFLFAFSMGLFLFGFIVVIMAATGNSSKILYTVYAWLAAVLFTMFLVYDTQMIIGGRKHEISSEEYIYGALQLYIDIVYLFLIILSLVGGSNN